MQAVGLDAVTPQPTAANSLRTAEEIADRLLALAADDGATESPFVTPDGKVETAATGCCCALEGSDRHVVSSAIAFDDPDQRGVARDETIRAVRLWLDDMQPLLATGCVWIGMWHNSDTGMCEVNLTLVARDRHFAEALGRHQNQKAVYDLDAGETVITGGAGGTPYSPEVGISALHLPSVEEAKLMRSKL